MTLANRVNFEFNVGRPDGSTPTCNAGYCVGGKYVHGKKIMFFTEQKLLESLNNLEKRKKILSRYKVIVLDEAHERSMSMDILLGVLKGLIREVPNPPKIVVTSATIVLEKFVNYFQPHKVGTVSIKGRTFPITTVYSPPEGNDSILKTAVDSALGYINRPATEGHVLVFLTGQDEVEHCARMCEQNLAAEQMNEFVEVHCLFGKQKKEEQQKLFTPAKEGFRRIIFSTNVAETSLTINGVRCVIDSGLEKESIFDHQRNMTILQSHQISKNSAKQREGRAGRTAPGDSIRLYTHEEFELMAQDRTPDIQKSSLGTTYLLLKEQNISMESFDWMDSPDANDVKSTITQLTYLQAIDQSGTITDLGTFIAKNQLEPSLGKILFMGVEKKQELSACILAAVLSVNIWWYGGDASAKKQCQTNKNNLLHSLQTNAVEYGDVVSNVIVFCHWLKNYSKNFKESKKWCSTNSIASFSMVMALKSLKDFLRILSPPSSEEETRNRISVNYDIDISPELIMELVGNSYFLNICSRTPHPSRYTCSLQGTDGFIHPSSSCGNHEFIVYHTLLRTSNTFLINCTPIQKDLIRKNLPEHLFKELWNLIDENRRHSQEIKVHYSILQKIAGKRSKFISNWEKKLGVLLDVDMGKGSLTIWSHLSKLGHAVATMNQVIQEYVSKMQDEVEERTLCGRTRILLGNGAKTTKILLGNSYLKVFFSRLPMKCTKETLLEHISMSVTGKLQKKYTIHDFSSIEISEGNRDCSAYVMCKEEELAVALVHCLDGTIIGNDSIVCRPMQSIDSSSVDVEDTILSIRWPVGTRNRKGTGKISFYDMESANKAFKALTNGSLPGFSGVMANLCSGKGIYLNDDNTKFISLNIRGEKQSKDFALQLTGLSPQHTETELRDLLSCFGMITYCYVGRYPAGNSSDQNLENSITTVRSIAFQQLRSHECSIDIFPDKTQLAGFDATILSDDAVGIVASINRIEQTFFSQPPQAWMKISYRISFHTAIFKSLSAEFEKYETDARNDQVGCVRKIQSVNTVYFLSCILCSKSKERNEQNLENLRRIRLMFQKAITPENYENDMMNYLFTIHGSLFLQARDMECKNHPANFSYIHWNKNNRSLKMYGSKKNRENMKRTIDCFLDKFRDSTSFLCYYQPENSRKLARCTKIINSEDRIHRNTIDRKACSLTIFCSPNNTESVRKALFSKSSKKGFRLFKDPAPSSNINSMGDDDCDICCCELGDDEATTLQACGHKYHMECFHGLITHCIGENIIPVCCQAQGCGKPVAWRDISSLTVGSDMRLLIKKSLENFLNTSEGKNYTPCPGVDCGQLFLKDAKRWNCDFCSELYCPTCCLRDNNPISVHPGISCHDIYMNEKGDLNLGAVGAKLCPNCNSPTFKYDGCNHITCKCDAHWCWTCGALKDNNSECYESGGDCDKGVQCTYLPSHGLMWRCILRKKIRIIN